MQTKQSALLEFCETFLVGDVIKFIVLGDVGLSTDNIIHLCCIRYEKRLSDWMANKEDAIDHSKWGK